MKIKNSKVLIFFAAVILLSWTIPGGLFGAPKDKSASASKSKPAAEIKAGDCMVCHKDKKVLPDNHVPTKDMPYEGCLTCHIPGEGKAGTLKAKIPGADQAMFESLANKAKSGCPVSKLLKAEITLEAGLEA